jgi:hypothetical protein
MASPELGIACRKRNHRGSYRVSHLGSRRGSQTGSLRNEKPVFPPKSGNNFGIPPVCPGFKFRKILFKSPLKTGLFVLVKKPAAGN